MTESKVPAMSKGDIAIVGMSVNVPGASTVDAYWSNLRDGVDSIQRLDEETLLAAGESPEMMARKNYVPASALLEGYETFDAEFFGFSPKDAAILDPQHRKFLETAWEAMEQAGHTPEHLDGPIGVYAGCGMGSYFYFNICSNPDLVDDVGLFLLRHTGNDKDFLSTRVSHVFDLKGPSVNLQTACSTSLVAIHFAVQALHAGEVDMALAGGVTIDMPQGRGYEYKENEVLSPDGKCHAFDHRAQGTVFGSGSGVVALRRLEDAIADGDHIWGVIKGTAVNNDGAAKAGYLAPSVDGQTDAILRALKTAELSAREIGLIECHGTGTYLGDPIEVAALTEAFRESTDDVDFCRIGSVKTNIGHLDTAAGVAGVVKATLALHHEAMPPSLGYEKPNPAIAFEGSPFSVNDTLTAWPRKDAPRHAAINSLGVGGTNAHVIVGEAPVRAPSEESDFPFHPILISGRSRSALEANTKALAEHLRAHPGQDLADVAYTLKNGRRGFEKRRVVVASSADETAKLLEEGNPRTVYTHDLLGDDPDVVFMFPGGAAVYPYMAQDLYETEPVFAEWMDRGLDHLQSKLDYDIRALWLPEAGQEADAIAQFESQPSKQLPLIVIVEYALAQLWMSWGVKPGAMVGHSLGENVAACLAGVTRFEDMIELVLLRGTLLDPLNGGGMVSVPMSVADLEPYLSDALDIASVNGPELTVVSGPVEALAVFQDRLTADDKDWQRVPIDIAAHSRQLDPVLDEYRAFLAKLDLQAPKMPFLSNRTGVEITAEQATDPDYWVSQLRHCVNFADCIETLSARKDRVYLEVGPGKGLSTLAQMNPNVSAGQVINSLRHPEQDCADDAYFIGAIGRLWACGVEADWPQIWGEARRNRVLLPTYQFQRSPYFIAPGKAVAEVAAPMVRSDDIAQWGAVPEWRPQFADVSADLDGELLAQKGTNWLIFADNGGVADAAIDRLRAAGHHVSVVRASDSFADLGDDTYTVAPEQGREGYDTLMGLLAERGHMPDRIGHFWLVTRKIEFRAASNFFDRNMEQGFYSLLWLGQSLAALEDAKDVHLSIFTNGAAKVLDEALRDPEKSLISGPAGVLPREVAGLTCTVVDLELELDSVEPVGLMKRAPEPQPLSDHLHTQVLEDLLARPGNAMAAWRGARRYVQSYGARALEAQEDTGLKHGGRYLVTGGFGGVGQVVAGALLAGYDAHVILLSRSKMPPRGAWEGYLASNPASDATSRRIRLVHRLEAKGGSVEVAYGDVVNPAQMRKVIEAAMESGGLNGVIHAAGTLDDSPILAKTQVSVDAVLAPKVQGLRVLDQLLPDGVVDLMVLFASTSTATRAAGQADYVAANEYFNAYAKSRADDKTRVVALNWGIWADVGMAAEAVGAAPVETLPPRKLAAPMLDSASSDADGSPVFEAKLDAKGNWVLDQHRMDDGQAVMPGTGMIEVFSEAAHAHGWKNGFVLRDLYFLRALTVDDGADRQMRVSFRAETDHLAAELRSDCVLNGKAGWQLHAQAQVSRLEIPAKPVDLQAVQARCGTAELPGAERLKSPQEAHLQFGPKWHVLKSRAMGEGEGIAQLELTGEIEEGQILHPGLMDLATGWAIALAPDYDGQSLWVPVSYGEIKVHAPLTQKIVSWMRLCDGSTPGAARFDVTICAPDGQVLVEVSDFSMSRLEGGFAAQDAPLDPREVLFDDAGNDEARPLTAAEERLAYAVSQGITAAEGPEAFDRAMALGTSQVYVSALPLDALITQADTPPEVAKSGQSFERPDLDGTYVAPRNGTEEKLAEIWENLLGVSPVGVEDSFFDLGGHSLIAVRLFATVKRELGVEFPISVLFEAPTIADCAALIIAEVGDIDSEAPAEAAPKVERKVFEHIVPLNGVKTDAAPLFIVAGMFGNVLNLRHLALHFSDERAVYGLQAKGLIGDTEPHETIEEAATDYLAELRQVQPHGPYLLSGYSGGGITAYEMARQLRADGEEVAVLAMIDAPLPVRPSLNRKDKALIKVQELREAGPAFFGHWLQRRIHYALNGRSLTAVDGPDEASFNNTKIEAAFLRSVAAYQPPDWDGPVTLFRPPLDRKWKVSGGNWVGEDREYKFHDNDWTKYAPRIEVIETPGDHLDMVLAPNVVVLASELREVIAEALETDSSMAKAAQ